MVKLKKRESIILLLFLTIILFVGGVFVLKKAKNVYSRIKITNNELVERKNEKVLGILYRDEKLYYDTLQNFDHIVLKLNNNHSLPIHTSLLNNIPDTKNILLTVEIWGNKYFPYNEIEPTQDIISGLYDTKLQRIYETLLSGKRNIFVRINPEMEIPVRFLPWENNVHYIESFRYIVSKWKSKNPALKFVWGPSGFMGAEELYPGDDVVDAISITLKSEIESKFKRYPDYPDVRNEIHRKLHRMRFFSKPVIVIENGNRIDKKAIFNFANDEIDTISKYRNIAYNDSLWMNSDTVIQHEKFIFGLHDPKLLLTSDPAVSLEHIFVDFGQIQSGEAKKIINEVFARNHDVILTVEPWRDLSGKTDSNVLIHVVDGLYDDVIKQVFEDISNPEHTDYLRFAHEMEIPITRYAWQSKDPLDYIRAFRHFMNFKNPLPANVKRVWGPAGDRGSLDFYPGDDVVDYVSFAAYGLPDKNITDPNKQESFRSIFKRKSWSLRFVRKSLFITEFGVKGPEDYQTVWLEDAARTLNENPQVIGINYFNMSDTPGAWGEIKEPDWSITPASLHRFMEVLTRGNQ